MSSTRANSTDTPRIQVAGILFVFLLFSLNLIGCLEEYDTHPKSSQDTNHREKDVPDIADDVDDIDDFNDINDGPVSCSASKPCDQNSEFCDDGYCQKLPQLALGGTHSCAILSDGAVKCWGSDLAGQQGNGPEKTDAQLEPQPVALNAPAKLISAGFAQTCVVLVSDEIYCWGSQPALTTDHDRTDDPVKIEVDPTTAVNNPILQIVSANHHSCILRENGRVYCWGTHEDGVLGVGIYIDAPSSKLLFNSIRTATQITASAYHSCALLTDNSVQCWGANETGQLGIADTRAQPIPVKVPLNLNTIAVETGTSHTCALLADSKLKCWGSNLSGQLGNNSFQPDIHPPSSSIAIEGVQQVVAGGSHTCVLLANGEVHCAGSNSFGQLGTDQSLADRSEQFAIVPGLKHVHRLVAGTLHTCAVHKDGKVSCWGHNHDGQVGTGIVNISSPTPAEISLE